jgi:hypothetical protein
MKLSLMKRVLGGLLALSVALAGAYGQGITTSGVTGFVTDKQGKPLTGATVTVVHDETKTTASTTTREAGQYNISGLRPGGPYTVTVSASGLQTETRHDLYLDVGDTPSLSFSLGTDVVQLEKFTVVSDRDLTFGAGKIGTGTTFNDQDVANVPTVRRDLQDIAVLDSRMFLGSLDQGGQLSAQGQNFRFNTLLIDGVRSDDQFGLNSNGFSSLRSPTPMEWIQSMSVELSPYDVRRAGFTGALLNVVTKSGTNTFHGVGYYEYTDQKWRGKNPVSGLREKFRESTTGESISGPILRDKLFFFLGYEEYRKVSAPPAANFVPDATQLAAIIAKAKSYNYDPGALTTPSNVAFQHSTIAKVDWNIVEGQRASFTYRRIYGQNTSFANYTGATQTSLSTYWFDQPRNTDAYVAQLNSQWSPNLRTEATVSYTKFDGSPSNRGSAFPQVQVQGVSGTRLDTGATITNGNLFFGTESSRQLNAITTKEKQGKLSAEYSLGDHTVMVGGEDITTKYTNAFVQYTDGYYIFANPTAWQAGGPVSQYTLQVPFTGFSLNDAVARWTYNAYSGFAQDTWKPNQNLTVVGGLRLDYPYVPDKPPVATGFSTAGFKRDNGDPVTRNNTTNSGNWTLAPRVGFVYNVPLDRKLQIRGGVGLFQGKSPAVWISNAYSNAGSVGQVGPSAPAASFTFQPDVTKQAASGNPPAPNINVTDPDLKQPGVWKANIGADHRLPFWDLTLTAEVYYNKSYKQLNVEFLNYNVVGAAPDGRVRYNGTISNATSPVVTGRRRVTTGGPIGTGFSEVLILTNTDKGDAKGVTLGISRPMRDNWSGSLSWTHAHATEVSPITSSVALSNYTARASFNPNEDVASTSNTDIRDNVVGILTRRFNFMKTAPTTVSLVSRWRTGHPYSWVYRGDANGDGIAFNDLLYVPTGPDDPKVTWASTTERDAFFAYVNSTSLSKYKGGHPGRNSEIGPSFTQLDLKITQQIPIWRNLRSEVFLSMLNIGNMINKHYGVWSEVPFSYRRGVVSATSFNPAGNGGQGSWAYSFTSSTLDTVPVVQGDFPASRWQVQGGFRIRF